jgi:hypothetical protein
MVLTMLQDLSVMNAIAGPDMSMAHRATGMMNFFMVSPYELPLNRRGDGE